MTDKEISEYIDKGGKLFSVNDLSMFRDGGTLVISTPNKKYYAHQTDFTLHDNYPVNKDNLITDGLLKKYIYFRIKDYMNRQYEQIEFIKNTLNLLRDENK